MLNIKTTHNHLVWTPAIGRRRPRSGRPGRAPRGTYPANPRASRPGTGSQKGGRGTRGDLRMPSPGSRKRPSRLGSQN